jgi:NitT/TauT family transport system substrate-binding protein
MHRRARSLISEALLALALALVACQPPTAGPNGSAPPAAAKPAAAPPVAASNPAATQPASTAPAPAPAAEMPRLPERTRVVFATTPGSASPLYVGLERGYFDEANVEVDIQDLSGASNITALLATGEVDVGGTAPSPAIYNALGRGLPIRVILDQNHYPPNGKSHVLLVRQDLYDAGQLRSMEQLRGRRVALQTVQGALGIDLDRSLRRAGMTIDDVDTVQLPLPEHPAALANGSIEAAVSFEPIASRSTERGIATVIRYLADDYPNHQVAFVMISTKLLERPDLARAFAVAWVRGIRDFEHARTRGENLDAVAAAVAKYNRLEPELVASLLREGRMTGADPNGQVNLESMSYDLAWYRERGYVERDVNPADFVDHQFADHAVRLLGPFQ